jgi:hypothetical protein
MFTYSINEGTPSAATNLGGLESLLARLPDNSSGQVTVRDLRDVVFTLWNHAGVIKETTITGSSDYYYGFDFQQSGIFAKGKMLLGKRQFAGLDVMTEQLMQGDSDIIIYNTKSDNANQDSTKVSVLASVNTSLHGSAPYLRSTLGVDGTQSVLDFSVVNETGKISILSNNGYIALNGVLFPRIEDFSQASDGDVLKFETDGTQSYLRLLPVNTANLDTITASGTFSLNAATVLINGKDVDLTVSKPTLLSLGGIATGTSFSSVPVTDVLEAMLYPYMPPVLTLTITAGSPWVGSIFANGSSQVWVEENSLSDLYYSFDITAKSNDIASVLTSPGGDNPPTTFNLSGTSSLIVPYSSQSYQLTATDLTQSVTATAALTYVYPYYFSARTSPLTFGSLGYFLTMDKYTRPKSDLTVPVSGDGVMLYYAYPSVYGDLTAIIDEDTGWNYLSAFEKVYVGGLTNTAPAWAANYNVYAYSRGDGKTSLNTSLTFRH